jgi:hypothetical protein
MKKNIAKNYVSKIVTAVFFLAMLVYGQCGYAGIVSFDLVIKCSRNFMEAPWHTYNGEPNTRYSVRTKGMMITGISNIVTPIDWWITVSPLLPESIHIDAKCIASDGHEEYWVNMWSPGKTLTCRKGDGISIKMFEPNDENPNKYQYIASLTIERDDEKKELMQSESHVLYNADHKEVVTSL